MLCLRAFSLQEDAHQAEERANSLDRSAGEHEGRHRALEAMVQKLQKKLDTCVSDRGVLSSELSIATKKASSAARADVLLQQC